MRNKSVKFFLLFVQGLLIGMASLSQSKKIPTIERYDWSHPRVFDLPDQIDEISGIAEDKGSLLAIDDDKGDIFRISFDPKLNIKKWKFDKDRDFEEIAILDENIFVLSSAGEIISFKKQFPPKDVKRSKKIIKGDNEFEVLFSGIGNHQLTMMCKDCEDDQRDHVSTFVVKSSDLSKPVSRLTLKVKDVEQISGKKIRKFKPSAAAIHPLTGEVFIVSSINKLLVVTNPDLTVKWTFKLNRKLFKQPEGLCFNQNGDLFISNEAAGKGKAQILIFSYQTNKQPE